MDLELFSQSAQWVLQLQPLRRRSPEAYHRWLQLTRNLLAPQFNKAYINLNLLNGLRHLPQQHLAQRLGEQPLEEAQEIMAYLILLPRMAAETREEENRSQYQTRVDELMKGLGWSQHQVDLVEERATELQELQANDLEKNRLQLPATAWWVVLEVSLHVLTFVLVLWLQSETENVQTHFEQTANSINITTNSTIRPIAYSLHFVLIPLTVFALARRQDRRLRKRYEAWLGELNTSLDYLPRIRYRASHYTIIVLSVLAFSLYAYAFIVESTDNPVKTVLVFFTIPFSIFLLWLYHRFSLGRMSKAAFRRELERERLVRKDMDTDENDVALISMEVEVRATKQRLEAYVLESALFGALAFSGFLQILAEELIDFEDLANFAINLETVVVSAISFTPGFQEEFAALGTPEALFSLIAIESITCSLFFLAVIASRLRYSDISDQVEELLAQARNFNQKEEDLIAPSNQAVPSPSRLRELKRRIYHLLLEADRKTDHIEHILVYMRYFRSLGILTFFLILVTSAVFVTGLLAWIFATLALLSLVYFQFGYLRQAYEYLLDELSNIVRLVGFPAQLIGLDLFFAGFLLWNLLPDTFVGAGLLVLGLVTLILSRLAVGLILPSLQTSSQPGPQGNLFARRTIYLRPFWGPAEAALYVVLLMIVFQVPNWSTPLILTLMLMVVLFVFEFTRYMGPALITWPLGILYIIGTLFLGFNASPLRISSSIVMSIPLGLTLVLMAYHWFNSQRLPPPQLQNKLVAYAIIFLLSFFPSVKFFFNALRGQAFEAQRQQLPATTFFVDFATNDYDGGRSYFLKNEQAFVNTLRDSSAAVKVDYFQRVSSGMYKQHDSTMKALSLRFIDRALEQKPTPPVLNTMGVLQAMEGHYPAAEDHLRRAIQAADEPYVLNSMAVRQLMHEIQEQTAAEHYLPGAIQVHEDFSVYIDNLDALKKKQTGMDYKLVIPKPKRTFADSTDADTTRTPTD